MELSAELLQSLQICGDSVHIKDDSFKSLINVVIEDLLGSDGEVSGIEAAIYKQSYGALATFTLEAAKYDASASNISSLLEDCKFSADRTEMFNKIFKEKKPALRAMLSRIGKTPAHVVDVDWRLDYYMKNNYLDKVNKPTYLITLKTEENGSSQLKDVQFGCTLEQLQDLVGKLKDATKSLEKATQI
ncbi:COMM domain-containing protein 3-like isoform X2 [Anneissia japonica]|uniref:COMM domain-containing protein 3-like isoform X2 n=1 Tax=Anneissia japonica TaxID=1529436 RepID=UPI0014257C5B|nr:COMM domain-containing protein 3-like isoform X2 [Anneissia japonica]